MSSRGQYTYAEIISQPSVWQTTLDRFAGQQDQVRQAWAEVSPKAVLFTGCGSTNYLSQTAAALLQEATGVPCRGVAASEIALFGRQVMADPSHTLLVAVSRSGTTSETVAAMERFRKAGGRAVWGITCYLDTPVGREPSLVLPAEAAQEESIAQTRSFSTMLLLVQALVATVAGMDAAPLAALPTACGRILEQYGGLAEELGTRRDLERFFFLGSGPQYGMACEAMLKMKEMSITNSEAYQFLEFRHGPKALADASALVAGLLSQNAFAQESPVLNEMSGMGATTLALSTLKMAGTKAHSVELPAGLPDWVMPVIYLPMLQLMAYYRSMGKGLDPDRPRNLDAVVYLNPATLTP